MTKTQQPLLIVENLVKHFPITKGMLLTRKIGAVRAVDGISFTIMPGETLGLVGESGSGKSTTGRLILRLLEVDAGKILFDGTDVRALAKDELRELRKDIQIIFQDPYASLNPRMKVGEIVAEPLRIHKLASGRELEREVIKLLDVVGLAAVYAKRYPHELSGGQRQRVGIARALALRPKLVVCDEPVSALDVSIQAQVLNLLQDLQAEFGLTYLFIAHDLSVVKHICDRVAVMYLGKIVELAEQERLFAHPQHPYTQALLSAVPNPDPKLEFKPIVLKGDIPSPIDPPSGCCFHSRCPYVMEICRGTEPEWQEICPGHCAACHLIDHKNSRPEVK